MFFATYEESHDVTRCVMLNGVRTVARGNVLYTGAHPGWSPRGAWGATWAPPTYAIWAKNGEILSPNHYLMKQWDLVMWSLRSERFGQHYDRSLGRMPAFYSDASLSCENTLPRGGMNWKLRPPEGQEICRSKDFAP